MRANSNLSFGMSGASSGSVRFLVGSRVPPGDGDFDLGLALLLAGLDLEREIAVRIHRDLVLAERQGQGAGADAVRDAAQRVGRFRRRCGALELELPAITHCASPAARPPG